MRSRKSESTLRKTLGALRLKCCRDSLPPSRRSRSFRLGTLRARQRGFRTGYRAHEGLASRPLLRSPDQAVRCRFERRPARSMAASQIVVSGVQLTSPRCFGRQSPSREKHESQESDSDQGNAEPMRQAISTRSQLFYRHGDRERRYPGKVHRAANEQQGHQDPAAADAEQPVAQAHRKAAGDAGAPFAE